MLLIYYMIVYVCFLMLRPYSMTRWDGRQVRADAALASMGARRVARLVRVPWRGGVSMAVVGEMVGSVPR